MTFGMSYYARSQAEFRGSEFVFLDSRATHGGLVQREPDNGVTLAM